MGLKSFKLKAIVSGENLGGVRASLEAFLGQSARIERTAVGLEVEATLVGVEARELNRRLLSDMRRVEKSTKLRAEWTADGVTEKFRDYVFVKERG